MRNAKCKAELKNENSQSVTSSNVAVHSVTKLYDLYCSLKTLLSFLPHFLLNE